MVPASLNLSEVRQGKPLAEHLDFMSHPETWPGQPPVMALVRQALVPTLFLVKCACGRPELYHSCDGDPSGANLGWLEALGGTVEPLVRLGCFYMLSPDRAPECKRYESLEAILADGWAVD